MSLRLSLQNEAVLSFTLQLFEQAGIRSGMHVLDVGCGAGDVSFLAAEMVGRSGSAVGVDRAREAVEPAAARARSRQAENVEFLVGDPV
jgi:ubiquinone/menaquinone biosynthesis C-methylase UbiE